MVTIEDFSRLVAGIYAAASTRQKWEPALRDVVGTLDAAGGGLVFADGSSRSQVAILPPEAVQSYAEHYSRIDHVLAAVEKGSVGVVRAGDELIPAKPRTEFHADWIRPYGLEDGLFVRLNPGTTTTSCLVVACPRRSESFATRDRIKLVSGLVVHLQQALRTQAELADLAQSRADLAGALEVVRHGIIIAGASGRVMYLNSVAEHILRSADGLRIQSGRVAATTADVDRQLHRALHAALSSDSSGIRGGRSFTCRRPSGKRPYVIHVMPLDRAEAGETPAGPRALLQIIDREHEKQPATALLRQVYNFTNTESEIAVRLTRGDDLKQ